MKQITLLVALLLAPLAVLRAAESKPALWAVYYAWYQTASGPHGKARMWAVDATDQPSSKAQPLIGYYDSDNPDVVRWHVRLAKAAGIEAFLVSWWGGANNGRDRRHGGESLQATRHHSARRL